MKKTILLILVFFMFLLGAKWADNVRKIKSLETKDYIIWLGDRAMDMTIGGDADAYRTLKWAEDQNNLTKEKMEKHYKSYQKKRDDKEFCKGDDSSPGWIEHCDGYWHTMTYQGKIYNCLGQIDSGDMYDDDICHNGFKYVCHINSDNITQEKIEKSCEFNQDLDKQMSEIEKQFQGYLAAGGNVYDAIASFPIPKRMEAQ